LVQTFCKARSPTLGRSAPQKELGSTFFWRARFVVALFGVAHFVAGLFWRKFHENNFFLLLSFQFFNL